MNRRDFFKTSILSSGAVLTLNASAQTPSSGASEWRQAIAAAPAVSRPLPDLAPASWIWYPSGRCLQNTFVLFRRDIAVGSGLKSAKGWIVADSRYLLEVNGRRVQFGPAPCDPRWLEADPVDLAPLLDRGANTIGATVLYYGTGDGTMPMGKPGFLFWMELAYGDGSKQLIVSDGQWKSHLSRAWPAGHYKRWYLRSLQEEFDARLHPYGWSKPDFAMDNDWLDAMKLGGSPNKPAIAAAFNDYLYDMGGGGEGAEVRPRSIPMMGETLVGVKKLTEDFWINWRRTPREYFDSMTPDAFSPERTSCARQAGDGIWEIQMAEGKAASLIFEFEEQMVGWPYFTIDAPEGTTVELLVQEAHQPGGPALLNSHFNGWSRFLCRAGTNRFEPYDFECCRWLQLHIHNAKGKVTVRDVGLRRRLYPWLNKPVIQVSEPPLQRLMEASLNTLNNCAQETLVDGMGRERQQYSGDGGHQLHAVHLAFGESRQTARFVNTFSQGMTLDGYFLDSWPAYDRLARLMERQLGLTSWGPILDHSVGFVFDCHYHYLYSGDLESVKEPFPRLLKFARYLSQNLGDGDLLAVENLGIPSVWIDHQAYRLQRHKQCAFNLYAAAMLRFALAPLAEAFGNAAAVKEAIHLSDKILEGVRRAFWSSEQGLFVANLPWLKEEKAMRLCDRSLATAILFDQCPGGLTGPSIDALVNCPPTLGVSYPANACWRLWALGKARRPDPILKDLRTRWATMVSVKLNNTLQEDWEAKPDSGSQWSHCAVVPLYIAHMTLAGIKPLKPGGSLVEIRPLLGDLESLDLVSHTAQGPIRFTAKGKPGDRSLTLVLPERTAAILVVDAREDLSLDKVPGQPGTYKLPPGGTTRMTLRHT
jgi:hypothetical protein